MKYNFTEKQIAYIEEFKNSASELKKKLNINYRIEDIKLFTDSENNLYFSYLGTSAGELEGTISDIFFLKVELDGSPSVLNDHKKYKDGDLFLRNTALFKLFESLEPIPLQSYYQFKRQSKKQDNQQFIPVIKTIERKKVKGGKYEFFIADEDGNFIADYSDTQMQNDIAAMEMLINQYTEGNRNYKDKIELQSLILQYNMLKNLIVKI